MASIHAHTHNYEHEYQFFVSLFSHAYIPSQNYPYNIIGLRLALCSASLFADVSDVHYEGVGRIRCGSVCSAQDDNVENGSRRKRAMDIFMIPRIKLSFFDSYGVCVYVCVCVCASHMMMMMMTMIFTLFI